MTQLNDKKEADNLLVEKKISDAVCDELKVLEFYNKQIKFEFKLLLKIGKKLTKTIKKKEEENDEELLVLKGMKNNISDFDVEKLKSSAIEINSNESSESKLSQKEAELLKQMILQLSETYNLTKDILSSNKTLYKQLTQIYEKDIKDLKLESQDIEKELF